MYRRCEIQIYADESCHLKNDNKEYMILGAIKGTETEVLNISQKIEQLKQKPGISAQGEIKWNKISPGNVDLYRECIDIFMESQLSFRYVAANKSVLDHNRFHQTHSEWYYKMYYELLNKMVGYNDCYNIFFDPKDSGVKKDTVKLKEILGRRYNVNVSPIDSNSHQMMQLVDILIGCIKYEFNGGNTSYAKRDIYEHLKKNVSINLHITSRLSEKKVNAFVWNGDKR